MRKLIDPETVFDRLTKGFTQKEIANELGYHYVSVRSCINRKVGEMGCRTVEQAVARFAIERQRVNS